MTFEQAVQRMRKMFPGKTCAVQYQYWIHADGEDYVTVGLSAVDGPYAYGGHHTFEEAFAALESCGEPQDLLSQAPQGEGGGEAA